MHTETQFSPEVENEIQARLEFKMQELLTVVKNRVSLKYAASFDMTRESWYAFEAFKEIAEIVKKETHMSPPRNDMHRHRMWKAKEAAVKNITESLKLKERRDYDSKVKILAREIENAQNA